MLIVAFNDKFEVVYYKEVKDSWQRNLALRDAGYAGAVITMIYGKL